MVSNFGLLFMVLLAPGTARSEDRKVSCEAIAPHEPVVCEQGLLSWAALPSGAARVCSGPWEILEYPTCQVSHPDCGAQYCAEPGCCRKWQFGSTGQRREQTVSVSVPNRKICAGSGIVGVGSVRSERDPCLVPDPAAAREQCQARLRGLVSQLNTATSKVSRSEASSPKLTSAGTGSGSSTFSCQLEVDYQEANQRCSEECGCRRVAYPTCEKRGPRYCKGAKPQKVTYSEPGLTEKQFRDRYPRAEFYSCTTCEQVSDFREKHSCLKARKDDPLFWADRERREKLIIQLKLLLEFHGYDFEGNSSDREIVKSLIELYKVYPGLRPPCGHRSRYVGKCGNLPELDPLLDFCARMTSAHTVKGISGWVSCACKVDLLDRMDDELSAGSFAGCDALNSYVEELQNIRDTMDECRPKKFDCSPANNTPCIACALGLQ